ncbi:MAG: 30S ribosomal protein S17e [archaeon]
MGRIKTMMIKRNVRKLREIHKDKFKKIFDENKKIVSEVAKIPSKKIRNIVAGYITRLEKKEED